jgi:hypothetical protein
MIAILVKRGDGNTPAPEPIFEPLLGNVQAAIECGRAKIEDGEGLRTVTLEIPSIKDLLPAQFVQVNDYFTGSTFKAKVKSLQRRMSLNNGAITDITTLDVLTK